MNSVQVAAILGILASLLVVQTTFTVGELYSQEMTGTMARPELRVINNPAAIKGHVNSR